MQGFMAGLFFYFLLPYAHSTVVVRYSLNKKESAMQKYMCEPCGYIYDPAVGDPDGGIAPGTAFEDIPDDWVCPVCGVGKSAFKPA